LILVATGCTSTRDPILGGGQRAAMLPMVTSMVPAAGATGVPVNDQTIAAQFNMPVGPFTGAASFAVTTPAPGVNPVGTVALNAAGTLATFTLAPSTSFAPNTVYTATITGASNPVTGLAMASPWVESFTTGAAIATTRPMVELTSPVTSVPGPTLGFGTTSAITATFTADMDPATLSTGSFTLVASVAGTATAGTVSYSIASRTATFMPAASLAPSTNYVATLTTAATNLAGLALAGNSAPLPAASNYVWSFTTGTGPDVTLPQLTLEFPANLASAVSLNSIVSATFSKDMDLSAAVFTLQAGQPPSGAVVAGGITFDPLTDTATFTPTANLLASTTYTATLTGAKDLAGNAVVAGTLADPWSFTTGTAVAPTLGLALGSASSFGIMATSAITNTGPSTINGDVSLSPGSSMTGFPPGIVNGNIDVDDAAAAQARTDLLTAYNAGMALPPGITIPAGADLGALYPTGIAPGTYTSGSTMLVATPLTLDAGGNVNATWVFQVGSSLTTNASLLLANGAQAGNIFWVTALDATIGVNTVFYGTILAGRNVTAVTGATIYGRILAGATTAGTIALQTATINVPSK
jgi:hypothetical protein